MKTPFWISLVALMVSVMPSAFGDSINGSASATWQSWSTTNLNEDGKPYWDNRSWD